MMKKLLNVTVAMMLIGTVLLTLVPTAAAQGSASITVTLDPASEKLKPLQGQISIRGKVIYTADQTAQSGIIGVPVQLSVKNAPPWASVTISPQSLILQFTGTPGGPSTTATADFNVFVSATEQAPAYQAAPIEITASASKTPAGSAATSSGSIPVQAEFFSIVDVQLAEAVKIDRPQQPVVFPLTITNFGNANTKVSFEVLSQTESLEVPVPNPITLQSKQAGGNQITSTVPLTVQTPYKNGYMNEVGVVTYKISSAYALDPKLKGDESTVSVLVTTKGFYVPGFSPVFLVGLLALSAVALRRFRN